MKELALYLLDHAYLDFEGGLSVEEVRQFLRDDDSSEARALLGKLLEDDGVSDLMVTVADCLKEYIRQGINEEVIRRQLAIYSES